MSSSPRNPKSITPPKGRPTPSRKDAARAGPTMSVTAQWIAAAVVLLILVVVVVVLTAGGGTPTTGHLG